LDLSPSTSKTSLSKVLPHEPKILFLADNIHLSINSNSSMARQRNDGRQSKPEEDWELAPTILGNQKEAGNGAWKLGQVKLREWLADENKAIVCPGVYDGLTARIALAQGFDCLYLSNAATTLARTALTDPALPSLEFVLQLAHTVRQIDKVVPLIAEVDNSLGVEAVRTAVTRSHHAEISALLLDYQLPRQCDKKDQAKDAAIENAFLGRIQATADERFRNGSDIVIIARTNMLVSCGCIKCYNNAIIRLQQAVDEGADVVFMAGGLDLRALEKMARHTFKTVPIMAAPHKSTTGRNVSLGAKIICYPDLFTHAFYQGVSDIVRGFSAKGEVGSVSTVPKPDDAGNRCGKYGRDTGSAD
jgi:2-methylisocitrate lyase-like PEP mutase family enzyme